MFHSLSNANNASLIVVPNTGNLSHFVSELLNETVSWWYIRSSEAAPRMHYELWKIIRHMFAWRLFPQYGAWTTELTLYFVPLPDFESRTVGGKIMYGCIYGAT